MVLPPIVVAIMWKVLFTPDISLLDWFLGLLGCPRSPGSPTRGWPCRPSSSPTSGSGSPSMLMLLAALQMMADRPLEAARIDGAGTWQVFWHVVLPLLRPAIVVTALFRVIESVRAFPLIFVMTGGGPAP
jgi:multiple sugar transport system permease protein